MTYEQNERAEHFAQWTDAEGQIERLERENRAIEAERATASSPERAELDRRLGENGTQIVTLEDALEQNPEAAPQMTTRADIEDALTPKPWLPSPPRPVKTFERGRWITREREPRRLRRPGRASRERRPARRVQRRTRCSRAGSARSGSDPPDGGPSPRERRLFALLVRQQDVIDDVRELLDEAVAELEALRPNPNPDEGEAGTDEGSSTDNERGGR